jgi:hypothetical protein
MSDVNAILKLFDPKQRAYLRRRAREHGSTVADELRRLVSRDMDKGGSNVSPSDEYTEIEGDPLKERILAELGGPIRSPARTFTITSTASGRKTSEAVRLCRHKLPLRLGGRG